MNLKNKKVLIVLAHADDEIICGWSILQDKNIKKEILICSSDLNNPERKWCSHRKKVFFSVCEDLNIKCRCLDYNSTFYKINARDESLKKLCLDVINNINGFKFDYVFTHNPMGEYGMMDHILLNQIVMSMDVKMLFTDIHIVNNWSYYNEIPKRFKEIYFKNKIKDCVVDMPLYNKVKGFYARNKVWTWNQEAVKKCGLYEF